MFTKEPALSVNGDCIVAVAADKALSDLSTQFKEALRKPNVKLTVTIEADGAVQQITAHGSQKLTLTHEKDMVVRKSDYVSDRTLAIHADTASSDLPRSFIAKLQNPRQRVKITLSVDA